MTERQIETKVYRIQSPAFTHLGGAAWCAQIVINQGRPIKILGPDLSGWFATEAEAQKELDRQLPALTAPYEGPPGREVQWWDGRTTPHTRGREV